MVAKGRFSDREELAEVRHLLGCEALTVWVHSVAQHAAHLSHSDQWHDLG